MLTVLLLMKTYEVYLRVIFLQVRLLTEASFRHVLKSNDASKVAG